MSELYNKSELHLFLIWNKAYYRLDDIVNDIAKNFNIIKKIEIRWSLNLFSQNLTQFYGAKLPQNSFKEKHCGTGPFTVIIVHEMSSKYEKRKTSQGIYKVNVRMFDAKTKFRLWTGGGHKIHATNSVLETEHDLMLLLGKTKTDIKLKAKNELDDLIVINRDIEGAKGWENLTHLFKILNSTVKYVILRNYETFNHNDIPEGDIDIITDSPVEFQCIAKAKRIYLNKRRSAFLIKINNKEVHFDIRYYGDSYYDINWQNSMINNRILDINKFYILDKYNYFYSLLYHALIHKPFVSNIYQKRLKMIAKNINVKLPKKDIYNKNWQDIIFEFLKKKNYSVTIPKDYSVFFDKKNILEYKTDFITQIIRYIHTKLIIIKKFTFSFFKHIIFAFYSIFWLAKNIYQIKQYSKNKDITNFKIELFHLWKPNAHYFSGYLKSNKQKVFIKFGDSYYIKREVEAIRTLSKTSNDYEWLPLIIDYDDMSKISNIIFRFIDGKPLNRIIKEKILLKNHTIKKITNSFLEIILALHNSGLIHRDIRPHNIIVGRNDIIYLIDFAYLIDIKNINPFLKELPHNSINNNLLLRLGNGYNPQSGYWDDAYSCQRILSLLCAKKSTIEILEKYVGRITWRISKELN